MTTRRDLLIALNAVADLSRDAVCRLALCADEWLPKKHRSPVVGGEEYPPSRQGITHPSITRRGALDLARAAVDRAGEIAEQQAKAAALAGGRIITLVDTDYPPALLDLELPPPVLYVRGTLPEGPAVSIVGSRRAERHSLEVAGRFGRELSASGLTVVSGLALGIDAAAHRAALKPRHGTTVAVLACGIDSIYPRRNIRLGGEIEKRGALVTEFPIPTNPMPHHFPIRNRLIAALSLGTLVVQAAARSGSLITARLAIELGRDVWAVPGPVFRSGSRGTNELIRDGALVALQPRDVLEALPVSVKQALDDPPEAAVRPAPKTVGGTPGRVLAALTQGSPRGPDELSSEMAEPVDNVLAALLELELEGWVRRDPGPVFHLVGET